jgi:hypothetical protein
MRTYVCQVQSEELQICMGHHQRLGHKAQHLQRRQILQQCPTVAQQGQVYFTKHARSPNPHWLKKKSFGLILAPALGDFRVAFPRHNNDELRK